MRLIPAKTVTAMIPHICAGPALSPRKLTTNSPNTIAIPAMEPGALTHASIQTLTKPQAGPNASLMMWYVAPRAREERRELTEGESTAQHDEPGERPDEVDLPRMLRDSRELAWGKKDPGAKHVAHDDGHDRPKPELSSEGRHPTTTTPSRTVTGTRCRLWPAHGPETQ